MPPPRALPSPARKQGHSGNLPGRCENRNERVPRWCSAQSWHIVWNVATQVSLSPKEIKFTACGCLCPLIAPQESVLLNKLGWVNGEAALVPCPSPPRCLPGGRARSFGAVLTPPSSHLISCLTGRKDRLNN